MNPSNPSLQFTTPVGRLVWGSLTKAKVKDAEGKPLLIKNGPDAGKPTQRFEFGLAIPKGRETHWNQTEWGALIDRAGKEAFPQGQHALASFAWKVTDGDSTVPNRKGRIPSQQEGQKGCWVLAFSSSFAPQACNADGTQQIDPNLIKLGHYVQVNGSVGGNKSAQQPGVFLNHRFVAHAGFGPEIQSGPDAAQAGFGKAALPPGASATPIASIPTQQAPAPAAVVTPAPSAPAPVAPAAPAAPVTVVPHPTFLTPNVPPAPPAGPVMTAKAGNIAYPQFIANGWTHEQLVKEGYVQG